MKEIKKVKMLEKVVSYVLWTALCIDIILWFLGFGLGSKRIIWLALLTLVTMHFTMALISKTVYYRRRKLGLGF